MCVCNLASSADRFCGHFVLDLKCILGTSLFVDNYILATAILSLRWFISSE